MFKLNSPDGTPTTIPKERQRVKLGLALQLSLLRVIPIVLWLELVIFYTYNDSFSVIIDSGKYTTYAVLIMI